MPKPVVLIAEQLAQSALDVLGSEVEIRHVDGADRSALLPALKDADAVLIRSATNIDAPALAAAPQLKVVARAGIGLDNVDVPAATAKGVLVVNAPQSNIITAAEHAIALLLSVARKVPAADASLRSGEWKRSQFTGVEIADKTVGVVGLGRIGQLFAARIAAFGTTVIAYDPYLQPARAAALGVRLVDLPTLLATADIISIHLPRTPETLGLIGAAELATVKPGRDHRQRCPRRPDRRAGVGRRAGARAGWPAPASTSTSTSRSARTTRCARPRTPCSPRIWARRPTRRRTRPAPRSPGRSSSRCAATSCRTR